VPDDSQKPSPGVWGPSPHASAVNIPTQRETPQSRLRRRYGKATSGLLQAQIAAAEYLTQFFAQMVAMDRQRAAGVAGAASPPGSPPAPSLETWTDTEPDESPSDPQTCKETIYAPGFTWTGIPPWRFRETRFNDGSCEYLARRVPTRECMDRCRNPDAPRSLKERKPEEIETRKRESAARSTERAKRTLRWAVKQQGLDRMLTLTTRENIEDRDQFLAHLATFYRLIRSTSGAMFPYVCVLEKQERGAYHAHLAIKGFQNVVLLRRLWRKALHPQRLHLAGENSLGNVDIKYRHQLPRRKLIGYLCKYIAKDFGDPGISLDHRKRIMGTKHNAPVIREYLYPGDMFASIEDLVLHHLPQMPGDGWFPPGQSDLLYWEGGPSG